MEYTVVIRKEHCIGTHYMNCGDCALVRAIKEQLPFFNISIAGGTFIREEKSDFDKETWYFDASYPNGWNGDKIHQIVTGEVESCSVTFASENHIGELSEANLKEASKIVSEDKNTDKDGDIVEFLEIESCPT